MTQTPTDPIRDEAVKVLAEAFWNLDNEMVSQVGWMHGGPEDRSVREVAEAFLDASPTLAADLCFAAAWRAAVASLPDGWRMQSVYMAAESIDDERWCATAYGPEDLEWVDPKRGYGPTPESALAALAAKLGSGK